MSTFAGKLVCLWISVSNKIFYIVAISASLQLRLEALDYKYMEIRRSGENLRKI